MIKSIVINNLKKIYNYVLTHSYNYDIFISTKTKGGRTYQERTATNQKKKGSYYYSKGTKI